MKKNFALFILAMLIVDGFWLFFMADILYRPTIGHLMGDSFNLGPAIIFYLLYGLGVSVFVLNQESTKLKQVFFKGALFGLVSYGTYDLTNQAVIEGWPSFLSAIDMAWGALLTGSCALFTRWFLAKIDRA